MSLTVQKMNKTFFDTPHPGGSPGGWGSKSQKSGKCHELPRKVIKNVTPTPPHPTGGWEFYGYKFQTSETFHELSRKSIFFISPRPHPHPTGGGVRGKNFKVTKHQVLKSISGMQLSCAIITLQIFWAKPGSA